jgi:DNA-binding CsgD family transcriptional regulator
MLQNIAQRYGLTSRECEIFAFMANDRSNAFIQKQLHISAGTVHSHIKSVYRKTGVHSRKHLFELLEQEKASLQHGKGA